ncbi:MAG: NlpC/P60 family protein [Bacteroidota bacterium]
MTRRPARGRRTLLLVFALGVLVVLLVLPVRTTLVRAALLAGGTTALVLAVSVVPRLVRRGLGVVLLLAVVWFAMPTGRSADPERVRSTYITYVESRLGTLYVWGGETHLGIDCSGLVRLPLASALFREGLRAGDLGAVAHAARLWWFDASAAELGRGYSGQTVAIGTFPSTKAIPADTLAPGDFVVTTDGRHAMVYAGESRWIEADPALEHVAELDARTDDNAWLQLPVQVMRWRMLETGSGAEADSPQP